MVISTPGVIARISAHDALATARAKVADVRAGLAELLSDLDSGRWETVDEVDDSFFGNGGDDDGARPQRY
jgi:hypothetical protein